MNKTPAIAAAIFSILTLSQSCRKQETTYNQLPADPAAIIYQPYQVCGFIDSLAKMPLEWYIDNGSTFTHIHGADTITVWVEVEL